LCLAKRRALVGKTLKRELVNTGVNPKRLCYRLGLRCRKSRGKRQVEFFPLPMSAIVAHLTFIGCMINRIFFNLPCLRNSMVTMEGRCRGNEKKEQCQHK